MKKLLLLLSFFLSATAITWAEKTAKVVYVEGEAEATLTFYYDDVTHEGNVRELSDLIYNNRYFSWSTWNSCHRDLVTMVTIDPSFTDYRLSTTSNMFSSFKKCERIDGLKYLKTEDVHDMSYMFSDCSSLTSLDLTGLDSRNVFEMSRMFNNCTALTTIIASETFHIQPEGVITSGMFRDCFNLRGGKGTAYDSKNDDQQYAHIDGGIFGPGYFTASEGANPRFANAIFNDGTLSFYYKTYDEYISLVEEDSQIFGIVRNTYDEWKWNTGHSLDPEDRQEGLLLDKIKHIIIDESFSNYQLRSANYFFCGLENCESIEGLKNLFILDLGNVDGEYLWEGVTSMFQGCSSLTSLDLTGFDTRNVYDMSYMFSGCSSLTSLDLTGFDTRNVSSMSYMFSGCSSLTSLDLTGFDTRNIWSMSGMFYGCSSLTTLDLRSFDTRGVEDCSNLFEECSLLETIIATDRLSFDYGENLFYGCVKLKGGKGTRYRPSAYRDGYGEDYKYARIDGGSSKPGYFTGTEGYESRLAKVVLVGTTAYLYYKTDEEYAPIINGASNVFSFESRGWNEYEEWDEEKDKPILKYYIKHFIIDESFADYPLTSTDGLFEGLVDCLSIEGLENLDVSMVRDMSNMFYGCSLLTTLDLSNFDTRNAESTNGMFAECEILTTIYASEKFNIDGVRGWRAQSMFEGCYNIIGGAGTTYTTYPYEEPYGRHDLHDYYSDKDYAHIDGGEENPGYFTEGTSGPICDMEVILPQADLKGLYLEVINTKNGKKQRYLLKNGCSSYTFYGLSANATYNVFIKTASGDILASEMEVEIKEENITVTISSLTPTYDVTLSLFTPDGEDVSEQTAIVWTSASGAYLGQGNELHGIVEGKMVHFDIELPRDLGMKYVQPASDSISVSASTLDVEVELQEFQTRMVSGIISEASSNSPLYNASVSFTQQLNGKYPSSQTVATDAEGYYSAQIIAQHAATASISFPKYKTEEIAVDQSETTVNASLSPIEGIVLQAHLTLQEAVTLGQEATAKEFYDFANIQYSIFNETRNFIVNDFVVNSSQIILPESVCSGDILRIGLTSLNNAFAEGEVSVTVPEKTDDFSCTLIEKGGIMASYTSTECNGVVGLLFGNDGFLISKTLFSNTELSLSGLSQGIYTLLFMEEDARLNALVSLSQIQEYQLVEGRDYLRNQVMVLDGQITMLAAEYIPKAEDTFLSISSNHAQFYTDKTSIIIGNYLTLKGIIDFKPEYRDIISDVKIIVDLPQNCQMVDNSVMLDKDIIDYTQDENRIIIPIESFEQANFYRFCILPTEAGEMYPTASLSCSINGVTKVQPIGSTKFVVEYSDIIVPQVTATPNIFAWGSAPERSFVEIYDDNQLIATTTSAGFGHWRVDCQLPHAYNMSAHPIHALVHTPDGLTLKTETKTVYVDVSDTNPDQCTMTWYDYGRRKDFSIDWNFTQGTTSASSYSIIYSDSGNPGTGTRFNFSTPSKLIIKDTKIPDVNLKVLCNNGETKNLAMTYSNGRFVASKGFSHGCLPINLLVECKDYQLSFDDEDSYLAQCQSIDLGVDDFDNKLNSDRVEVELISETEQSLSMRFPVDGIADGGSMTIQTVDFASALADTYVRQYYYVSDGDGYIAYYVTETDNSFTIRIVDEAEQTAADIIYENDDLLAQRAPRYALSSGGNIDWLKNLLKDGAWAGNSLQVVGAIGDLIDISKYFNLESIEVWCDLFDRQQKILAEQRSRIIPLHYKKCKDGKFMLSQDERETFKRRLDAVDTQRSMYLNNFYDYLDEYKQSLVNSVKWDIAMKLTSLGVGHWVGKATDYAFEKWKWVQKLAAKSDNLTRSQNLANAAVGDVAGRILGWAQDKMHPSNCDFEAKRTELKNYMANQFKVISNQYASIRKDILNSKSKCPEDDPKEDPKEDSVVPVYPCPSVSAHSEVIIDPSGYVYEAVPSNRVEGVTTTAYYREAVVDVNGDTTLVATKWDAELYGQKNPLFTNADGRYQWDVPQGEWQVKYEKEGYETTYSEWLPVPPPQLEVNVPIFQYSTPEVIAVEAYESGIIITFDKYMIPSTLSLDNISLTQNGKAISGTITLTDEEEDAPGSQTTYAKQLRINYSKSLEYGSTVLLNISRKVTSYAGVPMTDDFSQEFTIEREVTSIEATAALDMVIGETQEVEIAAIPAKAAKGKIVSISMSNWDYVSVDQTSMAFNSTGFASFTFTAEDFGQVLVTYHLENTGQTAETLITVLPNMADGLQEIANDGWSSGSGYLLVLNLQGQIISQIDSAEAINDFDITDLPDGIYIISFIGENQTTSKKVMKKSN